MRVVHNFLETMAFFQLEIIEILKKGSVSIGSGAWLNMESDLYLFGLHVYSWTHWLRPRNPPSFGLLYEDAIGQPR